MQGARREHPRFGAVTDEQRRSRPGGAPAKTGSYFCTDPKHTKEKGHLWAAAGLVLAGTSQLASLIFVAFVCFVVPVL